MDTFTITKNTNQMKKNILMLVFTFIFQHGFAQKGAEIKFDQAANTIDFGKITNKDSGVRTFEFTNTGDAPLEIYSVQSTTNVDILFKPTMAIAPNQKSRIQIKYTLSSGPIRKTITVETNATNYDSGRVALKIKGEVIN
jgi:hypothetical protein